MVPPFGITGYPTYIVIDGDGIVRWRSSGYGMGTDSAVESPILSLTTRPLRNS
jgi:hypothetical protein